MHCNSRAISQLTMDMEILEWARAAGHPTTTPALAMNEIIPVQEYVEVDSSGGPAPDGVAARKNTGDCVSGIPNFESISDLGGAN
jgi:hypothetical protein